MIKVLLFSLTLNPVAFANSPQEIAQDFELTKQELLGNDQRQREVMSALFEINKRIKKIVTDKSELVQEQMFVESQTKQVASRVLDLVTETNQQKRWLSRRLAALYRFSGQGLARMLFSSDSASNLERNLKILKVTAQADVRAIKEVQQKIAELEHKKKTFVARMRYLKRLEAEIRLEEQRLTQEIQRKNELLAGIRKSKSFAMAKLSKIRQIGRSALSQDETGLLELLFAPSFFEQKGKLSVPIQAPLTQGFGFYKDPSSQIYLSHKGLFFESTEGTPVKAVFPGQVVFSGPVVGFGKTLILDHGDHYYTVYSYAKELRVKAGEQIEASQVIASTGQSDFEPKAGLYFEIRHFSEPYDPRQWLKGLTL